MTALVPCHNSLVVGCSDVRHYLGVWGTWTKSSILAHTLLPHGLILKFGLCQLSSGDCKTDLTHDNGPDDAATRKGLYAYDRASSTAVRRMGTWPTFGLFVSQVAIWPVRMYEYDS